MKASWEAGQAQTHGGLDWGCQWQQREAARFGMCRGKSCQNLFLNWIQSEGKRGIKGDSSFGIC